MLEGGWGCGWGEAGGRMPLPSRPQRYCDPTSLVFSSISLSGPILKFFDNLPDWPRISESSGNDSFPFSPGLENMLGSVIETIIIIIIYSIFWHNESRGDDTTNSAYNITNGMAMDTLTSR